MVEKTYPQYSSAFTSAAAPAADRSHPYVPNVPAAAGSSGTQKGNRGGGRGSRNFGCGSSTAASGNSTGPGSRGGSRVNPRGPLNIGPIAKVGKNFSKI
jgi:hypothetical protein